MNLFCSLFGIWCATASPTFTYEQQLILAYVECVHEAAFQVDDRKNDVHVIALAIEPICAEVRIAAKYALFRGAPIDQNSAFMLDKDIEFVEEVVRTMRITDSHKPRSFADVRSQQNLFHQH